MDGDEGVCICEYMWHMLTVCCTCFTEGRTREGKTKCVCVCVYILEKGGRRRGRGGKCAYMLHVTCVVLVSYLCINVMK